MATFENAVSRLSKSTIHARITNVTAILLLMATQAAPAAGQARTNAEPSQYEFNDSHFHLTNYIQQGTDIQKFLQIMGTKVGRSTVFGIPLQQTWAFANSGDFAPTYYLQSDAPLYYYSFTDAMIAMAFQSLSMEQQARFDPMITGFNPADMYGVAHIRRVLQMFPGVFSGIGEFSVHKEFVSSKVAGEIASLTNPALDSILDFAGKAGLVVLLHNDIDVPFAKPGAEPVYLTQMKALLKRHPKTTIIWAHLGLGRVVRPVTQGTGAVSTERPQNQVGVVESILRDPAFNHVLFDISWDEVAKYIVATKQSREQSAAVLNRYPDRFLFGTDNVAPTDAAMYFKIFEQYEPLWRLLSKETREKVLKGNYIRVFDQARRSVRAWEQANTNTQGR